VPFCWVEPEFTGNEMAEGTDMIGIEVRGFIEVEVNAAHRFLAKRKPTLCLQRSPGVVAVHYEDGNPDCDFAQM
jgi:hypothetical protein